MQRLTQVGLLGCLLPQKGCWSVQPVGAGTMKGWHMPAVWWNQVGTGGQVAESDPVPGQIYWRSWQRTGHLTGVLLSQSPL